MSWRELLIDAFYTFEHLIIFYVGAINLIYFFMMTLGFFALRRFHTRLKRTEYESLLKSPLTPAVSVLAPAFNESATIRDSVRSMLNLQYPDHEVIIINDGSKDDTLEILIQEFKLYKSSRRQSADLPTKPVKAVYESRDPIRLLIINKENGGKADSLNAGLNYARTPLVAAVDSDSLLEADALLSVAKPFLEDPERVIAAGGIIRVANGCAVVHGKVTHVAAPPSMIARFQAIEYLRAFLGGRVAFSFLNSLLIISGAFGLFRRDAILEAGGFVTNTVGEDMELVVRLHDLWRNAGRPYRIVFVPEPVCWTETPETLKILKRQRNRWQRGTIESVWLHRRMLLNPKYGVIGMFSLPYFFCFEILGPIVELSGYGFTLLGLALGLISAQIAALFFMVSIVFAMVLSLSALILEELTLRRYPAPRDIVRLVWAAIVENFWYRQLLTIWRVQGIIDGLKGKEGWGAMERRGFQTGPKQP